MNLKMKKKRLEIQKNKEQQAREVLLFYSQFVNQELLARIRQNSNELKQHLEFDPIKFDTLTLQSLLSVMNTVPLNSPTYDQQIITASCEWLRRNQALWDSPTNWNGILPMIH